MKTTQKNMSFLCTHFHVFFEISAKHSKRHMVSSARMYPTFSLILVVRCALLTIRMVRIANVHIKDKHRNVIYGASFALFYAIYYCFCVALPDALCARSGDIWFSNAKHRGAPSHMIPRRRFHSWLHVERLLLNSTPFAPRCGGFVCMCMAYRSGALKRDNSLIVERNSICGSFRRLRKT